MCFANSALRVEDTGFVNLSESEGSTRMKCSVKLGIVLFVPGKSSSSFIIAFTSSTRYSSLFAFVPLGANFSFPNLLRYSGPMPGYARGVSPDIRAWNWSFRKEIRAAAELPRARNCTSKAGMLVTNDVLKIDSAWSRFAACFAFLRTLSL
jgi:hypothetical protein